MVERYLAHRTFKSSVGYFVISTVNTFLIVACLALGIPMPRGLPAGEQYHVVPVLLGGPVPAVRGNQQIPREGGMPTPPLARTQRLIFVQKLLQGL